MHDIDAFLSRYKTLTDAQLLAIINNPENYLPLALEAANVELGNRNLVLEQVEQINIRLQVAEQEKISRQQNTAFQVESALKNFINPMSAQLPLVSKFINLIVITATLLYIVAIIFGGKLMLIGLFNPVFYSPSFFYSAVPLVLYPIGIVLFGLRQKAGWFLLALISIYKSIEMAIIYKKNIGYALDDNLGVKVTGIQLISFGVTIICTALIAIAVCHHDIRKVYKISDRVKVLTIGLATAWVLLDMF